MPKDLHAEHFQMGVVFNLLMLNASFIAVSRHGQETHLPADQAQSIAEEAFGIVTANFLTFDDEKGTFAAEYARHRETLIKATGWLVDVA